MVDGADEQKQEEMTSNGGFCVARELILPLNGVDTAQVNLHLTRQWSGSRVVDGGEEKRLSTRSQTVLIL